jgi:hypothetical protein
MSTDHLRIGWRESPRESEAELGKSGYYNKNTYSQTLFFKS